MGKPSVLTSFTDRFRSGAKSNASVPGSERDDPTRPTASPSEPVEAIIDEKAGRGRSRTRRDDTSHHSSPNPPDLSNNGIEKQNTTAAGSTSSDNTKAARAQPAALGDGQSPARKKSVPERMRAGTIRFGRHTWNALTHSYMNILLVFVPIGIAAHFAHLSAEIVFAMNAIAVIPLAGILVHATESVAVQLGDTLGALLNVSFGNAVELIIFIVALVKNEIRIVQASLLGSILANLLLILGMSFLAGGLRFREQLYNATVTQMSGCLLSLSVVSLLLPTAFHASFSTQDNADRQTLKLSRGTSVILLLVYIIYLLFQLKSHAYLYQSMPQEIIDEESHPGILADILDSSSSSSSSSSDSSTDSDSTSSSHITTKRIKRAFRHRRRRKSTATTDSTPSVPSYVSSPNAHGNDSNPMDSHSHISENGRRRKHLEAVMSGDEGDNEGSSSRLHGISKVRDFETSAEAVTGSVIPRGAETRAPTDKKRKHKKHGKKAKAEEAKARAKELSTAEADTVRQVGFASDTKPGPTEKPPTTPTSSRPRPGLQSFLSQNVGVFVDPAPTRASSRPRMDRASSLPDMSRALKVPGRGLRPSYVDAPAPKRVERVQSDNPEEEEEEVLSRTAAVIMLLVSTGLVAICAEFLVDSIPEMTANSDVSQAFIGLIILPIVGNAAEHATAITVAAKNKMDLAIGVAVGSSIQIALFVTPLVVILGWIMNKEMTLYFTLFETVSLFATVFVVNFLVLDGRSNYLEGTLLISAYIIIAVAAFFYPNSESASELGGSDSAAATDVQHRMLSMMF